MRPYVGRGSFTLEQAAVTSGYNCVIARGHAESWHEVSGVIAFNTFDHDWSHSCVTVWFGRDVPWFFRRKCEDTFQIVCQDTNNKWIYHASHSWTFGYCVPEGHKFTISEGMEFCKSRSMELLRGSTLRELFYVSRHLEKHHHNNMDRYLVWDSSFRESVSKCRDLGLKLLNQSLSITHYDNLIDDLGLAVHYSEAVMYWLLQNDRDKGKCAVLLRNGGTFILKNYNCEAKLPFVCVRTLDISWGNTGDQHGGRIMTYW
ncbi:hypothetical protein HPB47_009379 [Ixodes persulcatus]|uniref:Uncharacterized protein n=1 Tax=Ixodes persulcatus TaxID=34615 RepID=A0AC60P266_IXOPE|nr:hypothetical protein HPB47_009379 [Ixodes persulcatus]